MLIGKNFEMVQSCYICGGIPKANEKKVKDHCHMTGNYRGAAHNGYNINYKKSRFIPVVSHNSFGYDAHFSIKEFASDKILKGCPAISAENKDQ